MISTGRAGRAVAVVNGGEHDGTVIRIVDSASAISAEEKVETPRRDLHEVLTEDDLIQRRGGNRLLPLQTRLAIAGAIQRGEIILDSASDDEGSADSDVTEYVDARSLRKGYRPNDIPPAVTRRIARSYEEKSRTEYRLDDGKMVVLPSRPDTERVFVAGKSGSGKSWFAASYMREYLDLYPDRKIFLFSTHEGERAYAQIEHAQIALDEDFVANPLSLEDLSGSLCVFDDCDALQDKKLMAAVDNLNLDLINNGRKYDIHVMTLAHQLMEYKRTRGQLNEANRVVFFPGGSAYHSQRYLKVYAGMTGDQIRRVMAEKTRWICLDLRLPTSYVTENAVVVVA
jgi:hypothetical protein